jgi:hypothetical protein
LSRNSAGILAAVTAKKPIEDRIPRRAGAPRKAKAALPKGGPPSGVELEAAILRHLRATPNAVVELTPLTEKLGVHPITMQLAVERLHARRMVVAPFVEPGRAGGAELTEVGLRWLIEREGGRPKDTPVAFKPAKAHVRAGDEAARLPRAQVYGVRR